MPRRRWRTRRLPAPVPPRSRCAALDREERGSFPRRMFESAKPVYQKLLAEIEEAGLTKKERVIRSPQGARIEASPGGEVLNFCANNYLGLANHPEVTA